jgi:hypothetical protein
MPAPVICFGQQPCGIFPRRFLFAKIQAARRLQQEIGGEIVFFYHDSDHDPRETVTIVRDRKTERQHRLNFDFANKIQKQFSPLFAKRVLPEWKKKMARQLPNYAPEPLVEQFSQIEAENVADFCLQMYQRLGLLETIQVVRSGDPAVRARAASVADYFVDVHYEGEIVRARPDGERLLLHKGGNAYIELPFQKPEPAQISPTRDTRLAWMQSVVGCTHYITGAGEMRYLNRSDTPEVEFITRDEIAESDRAYVPEH